MKFAEEEGREKNAIAEERQLQSQNEKETYILRIGR